MKTMRKLILLAAFIGAAYQANAQFLIGAHASRLNNAEQGKWGGGIFAKALIGDRFAAGINVKAYPQSFTSATSQTIGGQEFNVSYGNVVIPALVTFDYRSAKRCGHTSAWMRVCTAPATLCATTALRKILPVQTRATKGGISGRLPKWAWNWK